MGGYTVMAECMPTVDEYSWIGFKCGMGVLFLT
jgi:hypothetical protein